MAVVKADGYGHGATQVARTALAAGAAELGMATIDEALALRGGGSSRTARRALGCGTGGPRRSTLDRVLRGESPGSDVAGCPAGAVWGPVLDESGVAIVDPSADAGPHHDSLTGATTRRRWLGCGWHSVVDDLAGGNRAFRGGLLAKDKVIPT